MDHPTAIAAIKQRWLENWPSMSAAVIGAPVEFSLDNVTKAEAPYFARLRVKTTSREQRTMGKPGNRRFDVEGIIDVRLVGPTNEGTKKLDLLARVVGKIYESRRFGVRAGEMGVTTFATTPSEATGDRQSPQAWVVVVTTPFEFTDVA